MKLMIASDIHGAAGYCRDLLSAFDREGAARLLLLGDILTTARATICRTNMPPNRCWPCSTNGETGSSASAATATRRLTRWC